MTFYRALQDCELGMLADFFQLISSTKLTRDAKDAIFWVPTKGKLFEVTSYYKVLNVGSATPFSIEE